MVTRARTAALFGALALVSCYDMQELDPGPEHPYLLIDDFEDGDDAETGMMASASQFRHMWQAAPFNADNNRGMVHYLEITPADPSAFALGGEFTFTDPGNDDFTGVNVGVSNARPLLDARFFEAIHFTIRFDQGTSRFPSTTKFYVQLGCDSAPTVNDDGPPWIHGSIMGVSNDWKTLRVRTADLVKPQEQDFVLEGGVTDCLARVDSVRVTVSTKPRLEEPVTGRLYLDDIYFE